MIPFKPAETRRRLEAISRMADQDTRRHIADLGITAGWRCLEIGAGIGSIARWLSTMVEETGHVVATDVDTTLLDDLRASNVTVQKHDVGTDPLPVGEFDLVHARYVLEWVEPREEALRKMVEALKPGGWILLEEDDWGALPPLPPDVSGAEINAVRRAMVEFLSHHAGYDPDFGRQLVSRFKALGLGSVGGIGRSVVVTGASPSVELYKWDLEVVGQEMVAARVVSRADVDHVLALYDAPNFHMMSPLSITAWGRKPI